MFDKARSSVDFTKTGGGKIREMKTLHDFDDQKKQPLLNNESASGDEEDN